MGESGSVERMSYPTEHPLGSLVAVPILGESECKSGGAWECGKDALPSGAPLGSLVAVGADHIAGIVRATQGLTHRPCTPAVGSHSCGGWGPHFCAASCHPSAETGSRLLDYLLPSLPLLFSSLPAVSCHPMPLSLGLLATSRLVLPPLLSSLLSSLLPSLPSFLPLPLLSLPLCGNPRCPYFLGLLSDAPTYSCPLASDPRLLNLRRSYCCCRETSAFAWKDPPALARSAAIAGLKLVWGSRVSTLSLLLLLVRP